MKRKNCIYCAKKCDCGGRRRALRISIKDREYTMTCEECKTVTTHWHRPNGSGRARPV